MNTVVASNIEETTQFADVIVPVAVPNLYTYRLMREHVGKLEVGARIIVQFGNSKIVTAVVVSIHTNPPKNYQAKYILEILDETPYFKPMHLNLFRWIADYYMCNVGEVLNIALPAGLKVSSLSKIQVNPDFDHPELLTEKEKLLVEEIQKHQALTYDELARLAEVKNPYTLIKALIGKKAILVFEEVKDKYTPKVVRKVKLAAFYEDSENLKAIIGILEKGKKVSQLNIILKYLSFVPVLKNAIINQKGLDKSIFNQDEEISDSGLNTLIKNGIFETFTVTVSRFGDIENSAEQFPVLSETQTAAFQSIMQQFQEKDTVLLNGVTGSGKTEVYIKLIQQVLESGSQVLYLLPEIALTTQILQRLRIVFGDKVGIYHSKFSDNERVEVWQGIVEGRFSFVVGVRSSIFLPFDNLGLIIVDEEHESSYKQYDPAPRYHARDLAIVVAKKHNAKVLLGSATPSIESTYNAKQGKYGYVEMIGRYGNSEMPEIEMLDIKLAKKQQQLKGEYTEELINQIRENLDKKKQVLLFQNRRGFSPYMECEDCGWAAMCYQCDVSLTYHYSGQQLRCHYCGHHEEVPKTCPACGGGKVKTRGFGTQKVEDDMTLIFPEAKIARMDMDTTRSKTAFQTLINDVESGEIDMLIGTQMISKGLDFENVNLVCIFDADRMIHYPDFRSGEKAFQLLTQVAGRAGRRNTKGKVLIQTSNPNNAMLLKIQQNDYAGMYVTEIGEREKFNYPPFSRLIHLTLKHQDQNVCEKAAIDLAKLLYVNLGQARVLGPEKPVIDRIRDRFLFEILIKLEKGANLKTIKEFVRAQMTNITTSKLYKNVQVIVDVDYVG
jgi:primosomal protein N' (replication factor Y) (superfamily II helicase)